jgi:hypothetical protein
MRSKLGFLEIAILLLIIGTSIFIMTFDMKSLAKKWGISTQTTTRVEQDIRTQQDSLKDYESRQYRQKDYGVQEYSPQYDAENKTNSSRFLSKTWDKAAQGDPNAQGRVFLWFILAGGAILSLVGHVLILIAAFGESILRGLVSFFSPVLLRFPFLLSTGEKQNRASYCFYWECVFYSL